MNRKKPNNGMNPIVSLCRDTPGYAGRYARKHMIKTLIFIPLLLTVLAGSLFAMELNEIKSSDQLARFICQMEMEDVPVGKLLSGMESSETLKIHDYKVGIPIREIFGTIVSERFEDELDVQLFEKDKKYNVREICAFRDSEGNIRRFHIAIFEDRQYRLMKEFLVKLIKNKK
jgi:hypothetical protein